MSHELFFFNYRNFGQDWTLASFKKSSQKCFDYRIFHQYFKQNSTYVNNSLPVENLHISCQLISNPSNLISSRWTLPKTASNFTFSPAIKHLQSATCFSEWNMILSTNRPGRRTRARFLGRRRGPKTGRWICQAKKKTHTKINAMTFEVLRPIRPARRVGP